VIAVPLIVVAATIAAVEHKPAPLTTPVPVIAVPSIVVAATIAAVEHNPAPLTTPVPVIAAPDMAPPDTIPVTPQRPAVLHIFPVAIRIFGVVICVSLIVNFVVRVPASETCASITPHSVVSVTLLVHTTIRA
jgi:hypothetical protein